MSDHSDIRKIEQNAFAHVKARDIIKPTVNQTAL